MKNMKKQMVLLVLTILGTVHVMAQNEVQNKLSEADAAFKSGNLEETRFALQQSLAALDKLVGEAILNKLPAELSGLEAETEDDEMSGGSAGLTGVYVKRYYMGDEQDIELEIVTNSPFMSMVNASLTNPLLASMSGGDQSVVKIDGYKSLLRKNENSDGVPSFELNIPVNDSMIIINSNGFTQNEVINIANAIDVRGIAKLIGASQ